MRDLRTRWFGFFEIPWVPRAGSSQFPMVFSLIFFSLSMIG